MGRAESAKFLVSEWLQPLASLRRLLGVMALVVGLLPVRSAGGGADLDEPKVKALYIYNLARYTEWPASTFPLGGSPIRILIVASDRIASNLTAVVSGKLVQGRRVEVLKADGKPFDTSAHLIFLGDSDRTGLRDLIAETGGRPILTVAENEAFLSAGGMVSFHMEEGKVKLSVNLKPTKAAGLVLSSRLLGVATEVMGRE